MMNEQSISSTFSTPSSSSSPVLNEVPTALLSTTNSEAAQHLLKQLAHGSINGIMQKDNLKYIYKLLEQMKTNGCNSSNNPNYKLLNDFLKQQLVLISSIQQKRKQMTPSNMSATIQSTMIQSTLTMNTVDDVNEYERARKRPRHSLGIPVTPNQSTTPVLLWTQEMKDRLKAQIYCYKNHIVKREIPPICLMNAVRGDNVGENLKHYHEIMKQMHPSFQPVLFQQPQPIPQQQPQPVIHQPIPQPQPMTQQTIIQHQPQMSQLPIHITQQLRSIDSGSAMVKEESPQVPLEEPRNDNDLTNDQIQLVMSQLHAKTRGHLLSIIEQCLRHTASQQITLMAIAKSQQAEENKVNTLLERIDVAAVEAMLTVAYQKIKVMSESNWEDSYEEQTELIGQVCEQLQLPLNAAMELIVEHKKTHFETVFTLFEAVLTKMNEMSQINTHISTDCDFEYYVWKDWKGKKSDEAGLRYQVITYWYTCLKHAKEARWNKEELKSWLDKMVQCDKTKVLKRSSSSSSNKS